MVRLFFLTVFFIYFSNARALEVNLAPERDYVEVIQKDRLIKIQRIQDQQHVISGEFAKTSRRCPPSCIQPMRVAKGVETVAELEVFDFMENELLDGTGLLVDSRMPSWWRQATIPGSVNIAYPVFSLQQDSQQLISAMKKLGVNRRQSVSAFARTMEGLGMGGDKKNEDWDFSEAKQLVLWCNGVWSNDASRAIKGLLALGYPAHKIRYYRGGMQLWIALGLTTISPE